MVCGVVPVLGARRHVDANHLVRRAGRLKGPVTQTRRTVTETSSEMNRAEPELEGLMGDVSDKLRFLQETRGGRRKEVQWVDIYPCFSARPDPNCWETMMRWFLANHLSPVADDIVMSADGQSISSAKITLASSLPSDVRPLSRSETDRIASARVVLVENDASVAAALESTVAFRAPLARFFRQFALRRGKQMLPRIDDSCRQFPRTSCWRPIGTAERRAVDCQCR